ncbi:MAG: ABC transporter permease [Candidatus Puniceispirillaceae bacterium]|jgi:putative ABC transport system permease protein
MTDSWSLAWHFARCEIRGSVARFRVFLAALMLGVAAIGAVGSVAEAMRAGIDDNARSLLGGDFELSSLHIPPEQRVLGLTENIAARSDIVQMRAMLGRQATDSQPARRKLVELKAVDSAYPLVGDITLEPAISLDEALADNGAVAAPALLAALDLKIGDTARLGEHIVTIRASLIAEPDRSISFVGFGPRLIISTKTLQLTGLQKEGAFISYKTRLQLKDPASAAVLEASLRDAIEGSYMRLRTLNSAGAGFERFVERAELFLMLVGLTALLIGGLGVSGAVRAWLLSRMNVIATLKCLGASSKLIFRIYILQVMVIASIGVMAGIALAGLSPFLAAKFFTAYVNVPLMTDIYARPLLLAAGFGLVTTFVFAVWPLSRTRHIRAAHLFRALMQIPGGTPSIAALVTVTGGIVALAGLAVIATGNILLSLSFMIAALVSMGLLYVLAGSVLLFLRQLAPPRYVPAHLALSAVTRKGSPLQSIMIAFGLGLSVLVAVVSSQHNLMAQLNSRAAEDAPDWFFIDIQPQQIDPFIAQVSAISSQTIIEKTPMLRGRVIALNDMPASKANKDAESSWVLRGDRALTWQASAPEGAKITRGKWWPADYSGPPLMSITEDLARDYNLAVGDSVTLNILGREITAQIANARKVDWQSFRINFVFIMSPGLLDGAPHSWLATTRSPDEKTARQIEEKITAEFNNISAVSVSEAVQTVEKVLNLLGTAIQMTAIVTLLSGLAVLAGSVANSEAQRFADSMILKILGARRIDIIIAWILEYSLLAVLTGMVAMVIGTATSYALIHFFIGADFTFNLPLIALTAFSGAAFTICLGLAGAMRTLGSKPAPFLRETI